MKFDKNIVEFPTMLHRDIYKTALEMTPPEVSLAEIEKTNPELVKSGYEFYAFMTGLLSDMYDNPEAYGMHPGAYEKFANERTHNALLRRQRAKTKLHADQSAAELGSYLELIREIGARCEIKDGRCVLSAEDFDYIKSYAYMPSRKKALPLRCWTQ